MQKLSGTARVVEESHSLPTRPRVYRESSSSSYKLFVYLEDDKRNSYKVQVNK